jgi:protein-tyrosine phosphatase
MNTLLSTEKVPLAVWAGQEYHYSANARQGPDFQALQPLHSSGYVLIELPSKSTPRHWRDFVQALRNSGYQPVIAHPERHLPFVQEPGNMYEWIVAGAYFQLTAPSINGLYGREARKAAFRMAHNGWIHLLASDAHDTDARPLRLQKAYETLDSMLGQPLVGMLQDNARRLLQGEMLHCSETVVPAETRRGPIGFLRRNR